MELSCQLSRASTGIDVHDREPILISLDELLEGTRLEVICTIVAKTGDRQNGKDGSGLGAQLSITNALLLLSVSHRIGKRALQQR